MAGLEAGQRVMIIFHLWRNSAASARRPLPRQAGCVRPAHTLSPQPPVAQQCRIGVTVVDLLSVEGNVLRVRGLPVPQQWWMPSMAPPFWISNWSNGELRIANGESCPKCGTRMTRE